VEIVKRTPLDHMNCSIAKTLDIVGEWWTLLIVRDIFLGMRRFEQIRQDLGISKKILTDRLNTLLEHGVLVKHPLDSGFEEYRLTQKGIDLHDVIVAVKQWGDTWEAPNGAPLDLVHTCGNVTHARLVCDCCGDEVTAQSVKPTLGPGLKSSIKKRRETPKVSGPKA
jgi:DNA-binding HxlR family transcriptional regulator